MDISDTTLLRRWQQRSDSEAFAELVTRHSAMVFATSSRILRNTADAEDVTQECFMELSGVRTLFGNSLGGLLHTLATHRSLDRIKGDSRRREREIRYAMGRPVSCTAGWDDMQPHIDAAITNLPTKYRDCIIRHYLEGQTHTTIARALGIADSTVRYRITKGIERVRADLRRREVIVSADTVGTLLDGNRGETISSGLTASLGKYSLAGAGNAVPSRAAIALAGGAFLAKTSLPVLLFIGLAGLIGWTLKPGEPLPKPPAPFATNIPPVKKTGADEFATVPPTPSPVPEINTAPEVKPRGEESVVVAIVPEEPMAGTETMVAQAPSEQVITTPPAEEMIAEDPMSEPPMVVAKLEAIPIDLPEAFFGGTPLDYWGPNLEPENYNDRPPFMAPSGTAIVSAGKPVLASGVPTVGMLKQLTDGDKDYAKTSLIELPDGVQWVQVDLEDSYALYALIIWKFHEGKRIYFDVVVQVSDDPEFNEGVTTLYNNDFDNSAGLGVGEDKEYIENHKGRLIDAAGVHGRYVRVYGRGNTANDFNHFIEVEVWGQ